MHRNELGAVNPLLGSQSSATVAKGQQLYFPLNAPIVNSFNQHLCAYSFQLWVPMGKVTVLTSRNPQTSGLKVELIHHLLKCSVSTLLGRVCVQEVAWFQEMGGESETASMEGK
jgi:hypothetical protein